MKCLQPSQGYIEMIAIEKCDERQFILFLSVNGLGDHLQSSLNNMYNFAVTLV